MPKAQNTRKKCGFQIATRVSVEAESHIRGWAGRIAWHGNAWHGK